MKAFNAGGNKLLTATEIEAFPDPKWLIGQVLASPSLGFLYGAPGCGKTFVALSMALAVASGTSWLGQRSIRSDVLYVAAEGVYGLKSRLAAHRQSVGEVNDQLRFLAGAPNLMEPNDLQALMEVIHEANIQPSLIVIDTLARVTVGADENNSKDMGQAVEALDTLKTAFGAAVLVLHHTTKNGGSERGSSVLRGAADVMIKCSPKDIADGIGIELSCTKMKDDEPFKDFIAAFRRVELTEGRSSLVLDREILDNSIGGQLNGQLVVRLLSEKFADEGATNKELHEAWIAADYGSKSAFDRGLRAAKKEERIELRGKGKGARYFSVGVSVSKVSD